MKSRYVSSSVRRLRLPAMLAAAVAGLALVGSPATASAAPPIPTARTFDGVPGVGALFLNGTSQPHSCTADVISSPGRDLVLTAAHCLSGGGQGAEFAPGYHDGETPYGVWQVTAAYVDPHWLSTQDPQRDYAFLRIAPQRRAGRSMRLGDVVPGYALGTAPRPGDRVQVVSYPYGIDDKPITCSVPTYALTGYPSFDCHGYVGGTSGSGWLARRGRSQVVVGLIGGLHQGGCVEYTSYSPRFDGDTFALYLRAARGGRPDVLPEPGSDGC
jgi:V8-like Glu-specific endopeptidase